MESYPAPPFFRCDEELLLTEFDCPGFAMQSLFQLGKRLVKLHAGEIIHGDLHAGNILRPHEHPRFPAVRASDFNAAYTARLSPANMAREFVVPLVAMGKPACCAILGGYVSTSHLLDAHCPNYTSDLLKLLGGTVVRSAAPRASIVSDSTMTSIFSGGGLEKGLLSATTAPLRFEFFEELPDAVMPSALLLALLLHQLRPPTQSESLDRLTVRLLTRACVPLGEIAEGAVRENADVACCNLVLALLTDTESPLFENLFSSKVVQNRSYPPIWHNVLRLKVRTQKCSVKFSLAAVDAVVDLAMHASGIHEKKYLEGKGPNHLHASLVLARLAMSLILMSEWQAHEPDARLSHLKGQIKQRDWASWSPADPEPILRAVHAVTEAELLFTVSESAIRSGRFRHCTVADIVERCIAALSTLAHLVSPEEFGNPNGVVSRLTIKAAQLLYTSLEANGIQVFKDGGGSRDAERLLDGLDELTELLVALKGRKASPKAAMAAFETCIRKCAAISEELP